MPDFRNLMEQLARLATEQVNPATVDIDRLSPEQITRRINAQDHMVAKVVERAVPIIARTAEAFAETLRRGDRVFYIGAGTSGRLGVLDAAECPPTYGTESHQIQGIIAGGVETLVLSREGVEDNRDAAVADLTARHLTSDDMVIGLAASRRTPYTLAGLEHAKSLGCRTAFIVCNSGDPLTFAVDFLIELPVGPEAITGSTRMKSGTAQKMTLNMISTTAMVLLGKTYGNLMIDLQARSEKLAARSRKILVDQFGVPIEEAEELLERAGGSVKLALVMHACDCSAEEAQTRLAAADGFVWRILDKDIPR
jgi:N-acetylmuramic acid 6-phosphate etherase